MVISFGLAPERCFVCGRRGDIITFGIGMKEGSVTELSFRLEGESDALPLTQTSEDQISQVGLFGKSFHYLQAERTVLSLHV